MDGLRAVYYVVGLLEGGGLRDGREYNGGLVLRGKAGDGHGEHTLRRVVSMRRRVGNQMMEVVGLLLPLHHELK